MMRFTFTAETDHETGELGWKDSRVARNGPYGPLAYHFGLAHDVIDHIGLETIADEIMALASLYWSRYQGGYVNKYGQSPTPKNIGQEWANLARAMQDFPLAYPPRTCKLDDEVEEDISTIIQAGRKSVREEFSYPGNEFGWLEQANEIEKAFRGWFRIGYRKTAKRWGRWNMSPGDVSVLYQGVASVFSRNIPQYEGQQVKLSISRNGEIALREVADEVY